MLDVEDTGSLQHDVNLYSRKHDNMNLQLRFEWREMNFDWACSFLKVGNNQSFFFFFVTLDLKSGKATDKETCWVEERL